LMNSIENGDEQYRKWHHASASEMDFDLVHILS
jgi:hypothetical protein